MSECPNCKQYRLFTEQHICPPRWSVWLDWLSPEEAKVIFASDAKYAVEKYCEERDRRDNEYPSERDVFVRIYETALKPLKYSVSMEPVPQYSARQVAYSEGPKL